jgi:putative transposase
MANTFTSLRYHCIFSTKHRQRWITPDVEQRLWPYLGGIARQNGLQALLIGGAEDHIHILLGMPPKITISEALKRIKGGSSGWAKEHLPGCRSFGWQDGYGAFTVGPLEIPEVEDYIRNQREHHRTKTFQEEYRVFLDQHGIAYDERYLWD